MFLLLTRYHYWSDNINWIRFLESKLLLIKSEGCFEKDLLYLTLLAILKVNGAN